MAPEGLQQPVAAAPAVAAAAAVAASVEAFSAAAAAAAAASRTQATRAPLLPQLHLAFAALASNYSGGGAGEVAQSVAFGHAYDDEGAGGEYEGAEGEYEEVEGEYYDYDYDYSQSLLSLPVGELSAVTAFYGLAFVLGCVGNALVVYCVSKHRRMRTTTNYFLLSLACADLLLVVVCIPVKVSTFFSFQWLVGELVCKLVHCTQTASMACSILTLTTISLERYYAISRPIRAKYLCTRRRAKFTILGIWIVSIAAAIPMWFGQAHAEIEGKYRTAKWCTREWSEGWLAIVYETTTYCLLFLLPVAIMTAAYCGVYMQLRLVPIEQRDDAGGTQPPQLPPLRPRFERSKSLVSSASKVGLIKMVSEHSFDTMSMRKSHLYDVNIRCQVVKMLIAVVVVFITCWGPLLTLILLTPLGIFDEHFPFKYPYVRPLKEAFYLMAYFNSCLNPIIYGFMSKYFRKSFAQALACCSTRDRAGSLSRSTLIRTSVRAGAAQASDKFADADVETAAATPTMLSCRRASCPVMAATPVAAGYPIFTYDLGPT